MSTRTASPSRPSPDARWLAFVEPLRAFLRRRVPPGVDAEDVAQDVFLRLSRHRAALADVRDLDAWVFRVARSALTDAWRAERRRLVRDSDRDPDSLAWEGDDDASGRAELASCVRPFVAALPAHYRRALELTAVEGLSQVEAARREGISVSGMKSRVQRARAAVVADLQQCCGLQRDARGDVLGVGPSADAACAPPASFHQIQRRQR